MYKGARIGRFLVEERLGSGSFATVWRASDEELRSQVAIKILAENWSDSDDVRRRFLREARILRSLDFAGIIQVYDIGTLEDDRPYFAMEYADRGSLQERMDERARAGEHFSVRESVAISEDIARALEVAHNADIIHRDLKPSNILFRTTSTRFGAIGEFSADDTQPERLILADFGIARQLASGTGTGFTIAAGTPNYMAPEQASSETSGTVDQRRDIYSAAALLFELLTGQVPAPANSLDEVARRQRAIRPGAIRELRPDVPHALENAILKGLEKDPDDRFDSTAAWIRALRAAARDDAPTIIDGQPDDDTQTDGKSGQETVSADWRDEDSTDSRDGSKPSSPYSCLVGGSIAGAVLLLNACVAVAYLVATNVIGNGNDDDEMIANGSNGITTGTPTSDDLETSEPEVELSPTPSPIPSPTPTVFPTPTPSPPPTAEPTPTPIEEPTPTPEGGQEVAIPPIAPPAANLVIPTGILLGWTEYFFFYEFEGTTVQTVDLLSNELQVAVQTDSETWFQYALSNNRYRDTLMYTRFDRQSGDGAAFISCRTEVLPMEVSLFDSGDFFLASAEDDFFQLVAIDEGVEFLTQNFSGFNLGEVSHLHLLCDGDRIVGWADETQIFDIQDNTLSTGHIGVGVNAWYHPDQGIDLLFRNLWVQRQ